MPGKLENGAALSTSAMLTRHRKSLLRTGRLDGYFACAAETVLPRLWRTILQTDDHGVRSMMR
jgi:hypothetical protein